MKLSLIINEVLGMQHALTIPNVQRYCNNRSLLRMKRIRDSTEITMADWLIALQINRLDLATHFNRVSKGDYTPAIDRFAKLFRKLAIDEGRVIQPSTQYSP